MNKLLLNFNSKEISKISNPKEFLGGKGANLSQMGKMGLPVPPGFTISTKVCELFYKDKKKLNKKIISEIKKELKIEKIELSNTADPNIFKTDLEKNLFKKINELRNYFSNLSKNEDYSQTLDNLAKIKIEVFNFFDNVIVIEDDPVIKKNRLELIQMMCKTFDNYVNFSLIDNHQ